MTKERFLELMHMTTREVMSPAVSSDEFEFLMENCEKDLNDIEFDEE